MERVSVDGLTVNVEADRRPRRCAPSSSPAEAPRATRSCAGWRATSSSSPDEECQPRHRPTCRRSAAHCSVRAQIERQAASWRRPIPAGTPTVSKVIGHAVPPASTSHGACWDAPAGSPWGWSPRRPTRASPSWPARRPPRPGGSSRRTGQGITLVCRVKEGGFSVYSHPHRIAGLTP